MENIGLDLHKRESQICILAEDGKVVLEQRIRTERERFRAVLGTRARARILLEASTESEWVASHLEELGHTVVVADPNFAAMYATRSKKIKTDLRDARVLAEACRLGAYRPSHRCSQTSRTVRDLLLVRGALVKSRTSLINTLRTLLRARGLRLPSGKSSSIPVRVGKLQLEHDVTSLVQPLLEEIGSLSGRIRAIDKELLAAAQENETTTRLMTMPGVGAVTAWMFLAVIDDVRRFPSAHHVQSYLGLVPRERSSGEKQRRGRITKTGHSRMRSLAVESAWTFLRSKHPATEPLKTWAREVAARRGKRLAAVALARRLTGILYAMWRDQTDFGSPCKAHQEHDRRKLAA